VSPRLIHSHFIKNSLIFGLWFRAHGQNFHTSIWHIAMTGIVDPSYVEEVRGRHNEVGQVAGLALLEVNMPKVS